MDELQCFVMDMVMYVYIDESVPEGTLIFYTFFVKKFCTTSLSLNDLCYTAVHIDIGVILVLVLCAKPYLKSCTWQIFYKIFLKNKMIV
jgi:hypothetical protein